MNNQEPNFDSGQLLSSQGHQSRIGDNGTNLSNPSSAIFQTCEFQEAARACGMRNV